MVARFLRNVVLTAVAGAAALLSLAPLASADGGAVVSPGMEIRQGGTMCTLGFVDPVQRIAFSAGHCNASGPVTDRNGRFVGVVTTARDNTPDGTVVRTDQVISDYETISLASDVTVNSILPGGRTLLADATAPLAAGQPVCHFGIVTGESCGTIERVNNGWFTMENGVVSQKGDSGGPVYALTDNGKAVIIGLFNSTWGHLPAAVSWVATGQQLREDTGLAIVNVAAKN
ncbi:MAG: hypothetical protein ACOYB7_06255 [Mycobacterium sp.]